MIQELIDQIDIEIKNSEEAKVLQKIDIQVGKQNIQKKKNEKYDAINLYRPVKREYVDEYRKYCITEANELLEQE